MYGGKQRVTEGGAADAATAAATRTDSNGLSRNALVHQVHHVDDECEHVCRVAYYVYIRFASNEHVA